MSTDFNFGANAMAKRPVKKKGTKRTGFADALRAVVEKNKVLIDNPTDWAKAAAEHAGLTFKQSFVSAASSMKKRLKGGADSGGKTKGKKRGGTEGNGVADFSKLKDVKAFAGKVGGLDNLIAMAKAVKDLQD